MDQLIGLSQFTLLPSLFYLWGITRCCCLKPSDVHVFGGADTSGTAYRDNEGYDVAADVWHHFAQLPALPRRTHGAFTIELEVYLVYGVGTGAGSPFNLETERYTKASDSWATVAQSPTPGRNYATCATVNGKGYAATGLNAPADIEEYDPGSDVWTSKTDMPAGRYGTGGGAADGKFYLYGGATGPVQDDTYEYDPAGDSWATKALMPAGGVFQMAPGAIADKCYSWYGFEASVSMTTANYEYDPAGDSWSTRSSGPAPARGGSAGAVHQALGYCVGGVNSAGSLLTDNDVYDPAADSWTSKSGITGDGRTEMAAAAVTDG